MPKRKIEVFTSVAPFLSQWWTLLNVWLFRRVRSLFMIKPRTRIRKFKIGRPFMESKGFLRLRWTQKIIEMM